MTKHTYECIRIFKGNNRPTYGDKYVKIQSEKEHKYNDIITTGASYNPEKWLVLFEC